MGESYETYENLHFQKRNHMVHYFTDWPDYAGKRYI